MKFECKSANLPAQCENYNWKYPVHFWSSKEVREMLRITPQVMNALQKRGYLLPMKRFDGRAVYDDWTVYRAIHGMYPEITIHHSNQIKKQMLVSSRRHKTNVKRKNKRPTKKENAGTGR